MQRTKQQALMFLLGALLVGGVVGFSAERVLRHDPEHEQSWYRREGMYDDLQLTPVQRAAMDSVLDERNCQMHALMDRVKPEADSIRAAGREQMMRIMTPEQRARFEERRRNIEARRKEERAARDANRKRPTETCK